MKLYQLKRHISLGEDGVVVVVVVRPRWVLRLSEALNVGEMRTCCATKLRHILYVAKSSQVITNIQIT